MLENGMIVATEVMSVGISLVILLGLFTKQNKTKSAIALIAVFICNMVSLCADIAAYTVYGPHVPNSLVFFVWMLTYCVSPLTIAAFVRYWYCFISEKTKLNKWFFMGPALIFSFMSVYTAVQAFRGTIFVIENGEGRVTGGVSPLMTVLHILVALYMIVIVMIKKREIGNRNAIIITIISILPVIASLIPFIVGGAEYIFSVTTFVLLISYVLIQNHRLLEKDHRFTENNDMLAARMKNIQAMHEIYTSMYDIDMSTGDFVELSALDDVENYIPKIANCRDTNPEFCRHMMLPEFSEEMLAFVDIDTLDERMGDKKFLAKRYLSTIPIPGYDETKGIWTEVCLIDGGRNPDGTLSHVLFTTRTVHDEVAKELEHQEVEAKNNNIFRSLGKAYATVYYIDLEKDYFEQINTLGEVQKQIGASGGAQAPFYHMCENMMLPEYKEEMLEFTNLSTLPDRLAQTNIVTCEYQSSLPLGPNGATGTWLQATFIDAGRNQEGRVTHVIFAVRVIQATKMKELAVQSALEKALEAAEISSKAKTEFLFNMSHDIRTPMNAIVGFTELLKRHLDDREVAEQYIEKIQNSNEFLLSLINNVLDMARIESGKVVLDEVVCDADRFNTSLYSAFEVQLKEKNVGFSKKINIQHKQFWADETKLCEILLNIMSNAAKYTPEGGRVSISLTELPSNQEGYALLQTVVEDTGIGMSPEFLPHIFDEFSREKNSTSSGIIGTGLGMPIVKKLVDLMGGQIEVESKLGIGTKFTVTIPHKIADGLMEPVSADEFDDYSTDIFAGKRILMAEDNELNAEIAMAILEDEGFLVEHAADGIICVSMLEKAPAHYYDLVLMDVQMPNMDGYKATRSIRALPDSEKANIPIVAMTANAFDEDKRNAFISGMNAHLAKPLQIDILKQTLGRILTHPTYENDEFEKWRARAASCTEFVEFETIYREKGLSCGCLVYEANDDGKILYADNKLLNIFGCDSFAELQDMTGGTFHSMVHPEDAERVEREIHNQITTSSRNIDRVQYRIINKEGKELRVDDIGRKLYIQNGKAVFYVFVVELDD